MNNNRMGNFLLILMLLLLPACSSQTSDDSYDETLHLRLAMTMQPSSALSIIAMENGYFEKYGLAVTVSEYPSGKRALRDGLLTGHTDVAFSSDVPIVSAALAGKPINVIATTFLASDVNRVIARKDRGIRAAADLKGKRVATQRASAVHFFLYLFLTEHGLKISDVTLSFMPAEDLPKALGTGSIDAFSMREPYISEAAKLLGDDAIILSAPGLYQQFDAVVVDSGFLQNSPKVIDRLLLSLYEAEKFAFENPDLAINLVAGKLGTSPAAMAPLWLRHSLKLSLDQSFLLMLEDISRWMLNDEASYGSISPEYLKIIDAGPLERIDPNRITLIR